MMEAQQQSSLVPTMQFSHVTQKPPACPHTDRSCTH